MKFDQCDCDDPIPDPIEYELPDGSKVSMTACAECNGLAEWSITDVTGDYEQEVRSLVESLQEENQELRDRLSGSNAEQTGELNEELGRVRSRLQQKRRESRQLKKQLSERERPEVTIDIGSITGNIVSKIPIAAALVIGTFYGFFAGTTGFAGEFTAKVVGASVQVVGRAMGMGFAGWAVALSVVIAIIFLVRRSSDGERA